MKGSGQAGSAPPSDVVSFHPFAPSALLLMLVFYFFLDSSSVLTHPAHLFPSGTTPGSALPACQPPTPGSATPHPLRVTVLPKARVWINEAQMLDWGLRLQVLALEQQLGLEGPSTSPRPPPPLAPGPAAAGAPGEQLESRFWRWEPREIRGWGAG